jgi:hypothetical protein
MRPSFRTALVALSASASTGNMSGDGTPRAKEIVPVAGTTLT